MEASATKIELKSKLHLLYDTVTTAGWFRLRVIGEARLVIASINPAYATNWSRLFTMFIRRASPSAI